MFSQTITCLAGPNDIEWRNGKEPISIKEVNTFAIYMFQQNKLKLMKLSDNLEISLEPFNYELVTVSPVRILPRKSIQFAPIGLVSMLNSGGAIQSLAVEEKENLVRVGVKGRGEFKVFASEKPMECRIDGVGVEFSYDYVQMSAMVEVPWHGSSKLSVVEFLF